MFQKGQETWPRHGDNRYFDLVVEPLGPRISNTCSLSNIITILPLVYSRCPFVPLFKRGLRCVYVLQRLILLCLLLICCWLGRELSNFDVKTNQGTCYLINCPYFPLCWLCVVLGFHYNVCLVFCQLKFNICVRCHIAFIEPMHRNKPNITYLLADSYFSLHKTWGKGRISIISPHYVIH